MSRENTSSFLNEDITSGGMEEMRSLRYLAGFASPWRWQFIFSFFLLATSSGLTMLSAFFLGRLVDKGLIAGNDQQIFLFAALLISCELLAVLSVYLGRRTLASGASLALLNIRKAMFGHMQALPLTYYDREPLGRTVTRMTHDVEDLENFFTMSAGRIGMSVLLIIACMIAMILTDLHLGGILVLSMLPAVIVTFRSRTTARDIQRQMAAKSSAINSRLAEFINGHGVIRNFGLENWSERQFNKRVKSYLASCLEVNEFNSIIRPTTDLLCALPLLFLIWFGGGMVMEGALSIGLLIAFVRYCDQFFRPISQLSREIHVLQQAFTSMDRVSHFLKAKTEDTVLGKNGEISAQHIRGEIEFQNVALSYNEKDIVLRNLSFQIKTGETVGLLGRTGSGKTSTVSILTRLYEFQQGDVLIDGVSIREYDRASLRDVIGFVSQDVTIFYGSVNENLNSDLRFTQEEVIKAAQSTGLLDVLKRGGMSLESQLLDKGANISVGERQLIALTRILLKEPRVLILDEATANIDPELEEIIHRAVEMVMQNRTCLIIAHRLDTLKNCDKLLVFRNGSIVEQGKHDQLIKRDGYYQQLLSSNAGGQSL